MSVERWWCGVWTLRTRHQARGITQVLGRAACLESLPLLVAQPMLRRLRSHLCLRLRRLRSHFVDFVDLAPSLRRLCSHSVAYFMHS
jgi:hypothetical protein